MHTSPSGNVPRGHGKLPLAAAVADAAAVDAAPPTTTRRTGPTASADAAMSTAARAPARTSVLTRGA
jgi:hypothetical protein